MFSVIQVILDICCLNNYNEISNITISSIYTPINIYYFTILKEIIFTLISIILMYI